MFPRAELVNGEFVKSDHRPICVNTETSGLQEVHANCRPRNFEARWLKEDTMQGGTDSLGASLGPRPGISVDDESGPNPLGSTCGTKKF